MKFVFYTNLVSPHTVPLAEELIKLFGSGLYIYQRHGGEPFRTSKTIENLGSNSLCEEDCPDRAMQVLKDADILLSGVRDFDLMDERLRLGRLTIYQSERWFKPESLFSVGHSEERGGSIWIPGFWKMLLPFAIKRARRITRLFKSPRFMYLPIGIHAAKDMARLCGLMNHDWSCLFKGPELGFDQVPGGRFWLTQEKSECRYCLDRMRMWGYYVAAEKSINTNRNNEAKKVKVLWVGRMLRWKDVATLIRAVNGIKCVELNLIGDGPEKDRLHHLAAQCNNVHFHGMMPIVDVREWMRRSDVYVLSSNAFEGWGAVVNEALEEGMKVIGTYEAGASATILPEKNLFHAGDWKQLRTMLLAKIDAITIGPWTVDEAANAFARMIQK